MVLGPISEWDYELGEKERKRSQKSRRQNDSRTRTPQSQEGDNADGRPYPLLEGQDEKASKDPSRNIGTLLGRNVRERWARDIYIENLENIQKAEQAGRDLDQIRDEFNIRGPVTDERIAKAKEDHARINATVKRLKQERKAQRGPLGKRLKGKYAKMMSAFSRGSKGEGSKPKARKPQGQAEEPGPRPVRQGRQPPIAIRLACGILTAGV